MDEITGLQHGCNKLVQCHAILLALAGECQITRKNDEIDLYEIRRDIAVSLSQIPKQGVSNDSPVEVNAALVPV
jgi:hypothetical protein